MPRPIRVDGVARIWLALLLSVSYAGCGGTRHGFVAEFFSAEDVGLTLVAWGHPFDVGDSDDLGAPVLVIRSDDVLLVQQSLQGAVEFSVTQKTADSVERLFLEHHSDLVFRMEIGEETVWGWAVFGMSHASSRVPVFRRLDRDWLSLESRGHRLGGVDLAEYVFDRWYNTD